MRTIQLRRSYVVIRMYIAQLISVKAIEVVNTEGRFCEFH
jgi:hypothetical protein